MWTRRSIPASSLSTAVWPTVNVEAFNNEQARVFCAQKEAVELYIAGERVEDIARRTGVSRYKFTNMARKCLLMAPDGRIYGFRALIPYLRTSRYKRHAELGEKRQHQKGGLSGALGLMLARFPDIEDELLKCIRQDSKLKRIPEFELRPKDLHRLFIRCIKEKGVTKSEWPFTTRYLGLRTIQAFMGDVINKNFSRSVLSRGGPAAKAHMSVGTGHEPFLSFNDPYDAVEIDSYKIDAHLTVGFKTPEGIEVETLLERLWLIAAVDR